MTTWYKFGAAIIATGMLAISCRSAASPPVIAELSDEQVTIDQFYLHLQQLNPLIDYAALPASEQQRLLNEYVTQRVFAAEAVRGRLHDDPRVAARLAFFEQRVLAEAFRTRSAEQIDVDPSAARAYYNENKALYALPAEYLIEHLVYKDPEKAIYAQGQLRAGRPYAELAQQRTSDTDLVFVERNTFAAPILLPELREPVAALEVGEVTELIHSNYGYHVIRLVEKKPASHKDFSEVEQAIKARLKQQAAGKALEQLVNTKLENGEVRTRLDELREAGTL